MSKIQSRIKKTRIKKLPIKPGTGGNFVPSKPEPVAIFNYLTNNWSFLRENGRFSKKALKNVLSYEKG